LANLAKEQDALFSWINPENSGVWQYDAGAFVHAIALDVHEQTAYLLDGGRVLALNLAQAQPPVVLLAPGDRVADVPVLELLDLAVVDDGLLVLDRVGDLYLYEWKTGRWRLERYERPISDKSSHYYVAVAGDGQRRVLLETSYDYGLTYQPEGAERIWLLPEGTRPLDTAVAADNTYALIQPYGTLTATLSLYTGDGLADGFVPPLELSQPRQIVASDTAVYVLDMGGRRLQQLDAQTGQLQQLIQLPEYDPISTFWVDAAGEQIVLAGRDRLYWVGQPQQRALVSGGPIFTNPPHDLARWAAYSPLLKPVAGTNLQVRDLQMPGAPRHYRLGVHEGVDFYWSRGTPVRAAADGVVVRATLDYERPSELQFQKMRDEVLALGVSGPDQLDFYRGMQIWVQHPDGTVAHYAHLESIDEAVVEGTAVTAGQIIGTIGNTGSPASINSDTEDAHLHFELWQDGHYIGQYLRPVEIRELMQQLFGE
jgi:murein DD-endopeptidase MepM/ murein hydrolase activator NlpD